MIVAALDFETTGLDKSTDRVIELGLVLYSTGHNRVMDSVGQLVKTDLKVSPKVTKVTKIQQSAIDAFGYEESSAFDTLFEYVNQAAVVIGHNIRWFDWPFAEKWATRMGRQLPNVILVDTFEDCPGAEPGKLITMCAEAGFLLSDAHSALADAQASLKLALHYDIEKVVERAGIPTIAVKSLAPRTKENRENKEAKFRWNPNARFWWKAVKETDLEELAKSVPFPIEVVDKSIPIEFLREG